MSPRGRAADLGHASATASADASIGHRVTRRRLGGGLEVTKIDCESVDGLEPHALGVTYWFDPPTTGAASTVTVRLRGRRIGVRNRSGRRDTFEAATTINGVPAGTGPVAVTFPMTDVAAGEWHVTATAEAHPVSGARGRIPSAVKLAAASTSGHTAYAPIVRVSAPGARFLAWPSLVGVGVVCALAVQFVLGRHADLPTGRILALSLMASLVGLTGAKAYYLVEHRQQRPPLLTAGMCIQGFVLAALATLVAGAPVIGVSFTQLLDVTTPGLLLGMAIGRFGCFFGGCCAGRPTASRWGLWSSDRRLGVKRIPTQLMESALAFGIGVVAITMVRTNAASPAGLVSVAGLTAYTLGRQLLFPLRDLPRNTSNGRLVVTVVAASVLTLSVATLALV